MNAQTIMICSGKGGTGKSTVSVLLGAQLGAWSRRVLLIELDSGLRSVDMIAGVYGKTVYDIEDVLCGRCDGSKVQCLLLHTRPQHRKILCRQLQTYILSPLSD